MNHNNNEQLSSLAKKKLISTRALKLLGIKKERRRTNYNSII